MTKFYLVSEEQLNRMAGAAYSHGHFISGPFSVVGNFKEESYRAQEECRKIPVPEDATHLVRYDKEFGYLWRKEIPPR